MIELSVIIPTYNRSEILSRTLKSLENQTIDHSRFESIVIDDGSSKQELNMLKKMLRESRLNTKLVSQKHLGPAAARNKGIKIARGKIVLIINDDTVPDNHLLERHLKFHGRHTREADALLGRVTWHPGIEITPFMKWLENGGPYFSFNQIKGRLAGWQRLWTCNISFKKPFLISRGLFDEAFPDAAWEDVELGYRLSRVGLKLYYDQKAVGFHYHPTTIVSIKKKMLSNGRNLSLFCRKVPREYWPPLAKYPGQLFFLDKLLLESLTVLFGSKHTTNFIDSLILLHYRILGFKETVPFH